MPVRINGVLLLRVYVFPGLQGEKLEGHSPIIPHRLKPGIPVTHRGGFGSLYSVP
jgi:hypothetical protein